MKRSAFILLSILLLSGCADSTSGSYVDIESEKARQAELVRDLDTYEFTSGKPTELDEKPFNISSLGITSIGTKTFCIGSVGVSSCVLDTESERFLHLCNIAGCAHSHNSPGCLDQLQMNAPVAASNGLYFTSGNALMLFDGKEQEPIYENTFSTSYEKEFFPDSSNSLGGIMSQGGRLYILGASWFRTFDVTTNTASEPVILSEDSSIISYAANEDYLFFCTENNELFSCSFADNKLKKLDDKAGQVSVSGGRLYYIKWEGQTPILMSAERDGSSPQRLIENCYVGCCITDKAIYYTHFHTDEGKVYVYDLKTRQTAEYDISCKVREDNADTEDIDEEICYPQGGFMPRIMWNSQTDKVFVLDTITDGDGQLTNGRIGFVFQNGSTDHSIITDGV